MRTTTLKNSAAWNMICLERIMKTIMDTHEALVCAHGNHQSYLQGSRWGDEIRFRPSYSLVPIDGPVADNDVPVYPTACCSAREDVSE
jgi:hypothetical protein